jgi:hypothetical protein
LLMLHVATSTSKQIWMSIANKLRILYLMLQCSHHCNERHISGSKNWIMQLVRQEESDQ